MSSLVLLLTVKGASFPLRPKRAADEGRKGPSIHIYPLGHFHSLIQCEHICILQIRDLRHSNRLTANQEELRMQVETDVSVRMCV